MLDLGFLEDVERILVADAVGAPDGALLGDDAGARSARSRTSYMYDPLVVEVKAATMTIDTVEQFQLPVETREKAAKLVEVLRRRAARPGDRLRAHQDPLRPAVPNAA